MTGTPEGSTESGFMEGIEPATPALQGMALIHYTTGASFQLKLVSNKFLVIDFFLAVQYKNPSNSN